MSSANWPRPGGREGRRAGIAGARMGGERRYSVVIFSFVEPI